MLLNWRQFFVFIILLKLQLMEEEIKEFTTRLLAGTLSDDNIIEQRLRRFENIDDRRLNVLLNHQFFASSNRLTAYLLQALQEDPRQSQLIRKKVYQFISNHIRNHYLFLIDHAKNLFAQMISLFWKEQGRLKQSSIEPISAIIQVYDEDFLINNDILKPQKLHEDVKIMLQTQKKSHGVIGQCWYLLAVIQSKFPHMINPTKKKTVQQMIFIEMKQYVNTDKNLNTIASLIRGLSRSLKQNYFGQVLIEELFKYVMVLISPLKATYAVHLAALQLLSQRRELFHSNIMFQARKLFGILREGVNHKNKDYKMKCLQVLIQINQELVKGISQNKQKYRSIFVFIQKQILQDLQIYVSKDKGQPISQQKKGLNLLTVVRLLGIISPLYLQFQGKKHYKQMFDYIIKKCTKKIIKQNHLYTIPNSKSYDIKYVLYAQKQLNCFILSLSRLVQHLDQIQYSAANQLEEIFISAVKESKYFLAKYQPDLWEALIQLIMSIHSKGAIFSKWSKKVISESLKECLDSKKMGVQNDDEFIKMIQKAGHFWKSVLAHSSWRTGPLHEFTDYLLSNIEYLILNLNCGYRIKGQGDQIEEGQNLQSQSQQEDIVQIFYLANQKIQITKIEDYQYLSSLSLLFHQILTCIDPSLYNQKIINFYPQILERIKSYPKCLPLLRTLRTLNQYILKNNVFKQYLNIQVQFSKELVQKMVKFFDYAYQIVFKFQQQYFYQLLKVLLSFSQQVYLHNSHRIIKHHLPNLLIKTFQMGQQIMSLANAALRCMARLFTSQRQVSQRYLLPVISSLQKYINLTTNSQRQEFKSQLFLFELSITREELSSSILSFLGSLGGLCHQLVDSKNKDHISWDYDCHLEVQINILNEKLTLNLTRMLNRICWLAINGKDEIKIVACQLLHAKITYVIEQIVSNKMDKQNLSVFLDRVLPTILTIASNTSHPSQQLIHTLLIQMIHFFANTKQPNSPDVQIILKHLLSLYNKSEDMGFIASKCLSEFIRWHIKQQSQKNGDVPILKALMSNIWSLVGNKNARQGIINFLIKLLKIIHRQNEIMRYYSIELGSLLISLARYHNKLEPQFKYLLQKYTACIKKYMRYLIIPQDGRRYKKTPTIHAFLQDLYKAGFFSIYQQQRQASFLICFTILKENSDQLGYNQLKFLRDRAHKQKKYLFGSSHQVDFRQVQQADFGKFCWRLIALGEIWVKIFDQKIFSEDNLVQFLDLQCIYLVSFVSLLVYLQNAQQNGSNSWNQEIQQSIITNFRTFLKIIKTFNPGNSSLILGKFYFNLDQSNFNQKIFHDYLFNIVFKPQTFIKNFNRDIFNTTQLKLYLQYFINYFIVKENNRVSPLQKVFTLLNSQIKFNIDKIVDYFCCDQTASERTILSIMQFIKIAYKYEVEKHILNKGQNNYLKTLISKLLNQYQKGKIQRQYNLVKFILSFSYSITHKFALFQIQTNSHIFQRYQKFFIDYIVRNWQSIDKSMIKISLTSINNIKVLYVLLIKLNLQQKERFLLPLSQQLIAQNLIRDLLKINFLLVKQLDFSQRQKEHNIEKYIHYLEKLIDQGLVIENSIEIHQETLYLCGIILHKKMQFGATLIKTIKANLNTLGNKYSPYCISKLDNPQKQESAMKYFNIVRNFIVISQEFVFIEQFFIELKDSQLSQPRKETINNYIQDCVRTCFTLQNQRPLQWAQMILSFYWDEELDKDEWLNYRLLILQYFFRKAVTYMKVQHLQILYDKYVVDLQKILKRPLSFDSLKSLLLDMQVKNGAFLIVQLLYDNLPRRQKKEGVKSENQIHKIFIKYSIDVAKKVLDENLMRLIRQNDQKVGQTKKAIKVYKQHNCYAYNCLVVLFISTQSNPQHFKTFLFEHNKQALWDNLVDTNQEDFNFQIETSFKVIQPFSPLRNKIKQIQTKIEKTYFQSSLYVVQQQNIPLGNLQQIAEENEDEQQAVPIKNTHNIMMVNTLIEEDIINKHPCMMNLLRVIDYLNTNFPQAYPTWMKPIEIYLSNPNIKLAQIIFITKLILNRPNIFHQAEVWAGHLLNYLSLKETGGKFIHYFYRDALKRFLKFLPQLVKVKPDISKINFIIMKIIKSLPHDNVRVFSDNIDMLQELLRIPGVYIQKKTINSMLNTEKDKNDWRMCAVITLKLCISARVPVLAQKDYLRLKDTPARFDYYYSQIKNYIKFVYELASESNKKYRIAAAGFLGQFLGFLFTSDLEQHQKKQHFRSVSIYLISLLEKAANRSTKQKFTLALQKISIRFPQLLADQKLFAIVQDGLFQFNGTQRYELLLAFKEFTRSLLAFSQITKILNFFMLLRVNCQKLVSDVNEVRITLLQILNLCTDHRLLKDKNILFSFYLVVDKLDTLKEINEPISLEYYELLIKLKKYLINPEARHFDFSPNLLAKIEEKLIEGLNNKYESSYKMLFNEFQQEAALMNQPQNINRYIKILKKLYNKKSQGQWLINVVPIILTLCRISSDYGRLFSQTKLEENMFYYDWDFRNFKINDASLPYTPFTLYADKRKDGPQKQSSGVSQGNNLRGMIRATQNNYLSQEEQIFTMLQSLSSSQSQASQMQGSQLQSNENKQDDQNNKYHKINDLFRNKRRRNEVMDNFKQSNMNKSSPAVQFIQDKIRFVKNYKVESSGFAKTFRKKQSKDKMRKGAILRAYKIGQLPNIEISLQHIMQPLIFLAAKDNQLSSEIFLQFTSKICAFSLKNRDIVQDTICNLLIQSAQFNFNFISTLQKCMIKICQKHNKFLDLSLRQIAVQSNTIDYAVLFTEQNIIQLLLQRQSTDLQSLKGKKEKVLRQWFDLADYYQLLNEIDLIESVMIRITEGQHREKLTKALKRKKDGDLAEAQGLINQILADNVSERLNKFLQRQKIDCSVLLSQWDQICTDSANKIQRGQRQSSQQLKMLSIAIQNIEPSKRSKFLPLIDIDGEKYEYQRGILSVMKQNEMDKARYHSLNARQLFRRQWDRVSSFAFNSKHQLLQSLQKNYQLIQFLQLYKQSQARDKDCTQLFQKWSTRKPDQIFDDNITWIQILSSRTMYGSFLGDRWSLTPESMAKSNTQWLVQVVNGMIGKGVLGYAQNVIRKALKLHKLSKEFNWKFYESISQLKLMQLIKKGSMKIQDYEIVPKLIKKEMDTFEDTSNLSKFKLITIRNEYLQGYLQVCLDKRSQMDLGQFAIQVINIYKSYEQVKKGLKNNMSDSSIEQQFQKNIHFRYAVFLENLLSIVKGKFQIKQLKQPLEKFNLNVKHISLKFMQELVYSIKLLDLSRNSSLNYEDGQQLFSMILKLIKIVQIQHKTIGKNFEDAISDKNIPKWIFIYFIPQIIKNINNFDIAIHFRQLFDYLLANYPQALVYPFNCTYPRKKDCLTELTKYLYDELHLKMGKYFEFIDNLALTQHPQMRLKDILTKHLYHGQQENAVLELKEFNAPNPLFGKYNQRFHQNYKQKIANLLEYKRKNQTKQMNDLIKNMITALDPNKSNMMKYFTKLSDGSHWFQDYNCSDWARLQVPGTSYNQFEQPHLWNKVYIESFDNSVLTLTSIRRPKRITLLGSNEKVYMLLVKGGEDVRLDQRVEHLFELVNRIMDHNTQTNKKQLQISRFEVIPMKPMFGVFEWVDKSKTLRSFYEAELKQIKGKPEANLSTQNEGFAQFHAYFKRLCPTSDDKHVWHKALMARSQQQVVKNMNRCEARIPYGLLRFGLQKLAKNYDSFLHLKNKFISNYSAICLITYIFGIGDRHLENFLIQTSTGNLVMIDFGYSFGASIELPIPQLIPFRLTKSIKELAAPIGIEGSFKKCMLACFQALNKKMHLIVDYCDVFVDDPLMQWVWVSRRQLNQSSHQVVYISSGGQSFSVSQEAPQKKLFSNKIKVVENKLRGQNPRLILQLLLTDSRHKSTPYIDSLKKAIWGKSKFKNDILSGQQLINELISLATDRNITGRSYIGLNLFV